MNVGPTQSGLPFGLSETQTHSFAVFLCPRSPCLRSAWLTMGRSIFCGRTTAFTSTLGSMERVPAPSLREIETVVEFMVRVFRRRADYLARSRRCSRLDPPLPGSPPHLDEHVSAAPGLSPGIVADDELLLREMFNPQHVRDGKLLPSAISLHDLRSRGFSVHRMKYVSLAFVKVSMEARLSRPRKDEPWKSEGVAKLDAREVRQLCVDDEQAFVVIDTALKDNRGHASIYAAEPGKGDAYARELRFLLLPLLQHRMTVDEAFQ